MKESERERDRERERKRDREREREAERDRERERDRVRERERERRGRERERERRGRERERKRVEKREEKRFRKPSKNLFTFDIEKLTILKLFEYSKLERQKIKIIFLYFQYCDSNSNLEVHIFKSIILKATSYINDALID